MSKRKWVPVEIADEFRLLCADFFHWRALTVYVGGPQDDERRLRHDYLVSLASEPQVATIDLRVQVEGGLLSHIDLEVAVEQIWEASAHEPPPTCWAMRTLILRAMLARRDSDLRSRLIERAKAALQQARRDAEPPELWAPVADLVERVVTNSGES